MRLNGLCKENASLVLPDQFNRVPHTPTRTSPSLLPAHGVYGSPDEWDDHYEDNNRADQQH